ncbi:substrate-binding domain-containing protein [Deinococcus sp. JMULE3]|uniref:substrate-binding domain-containing protein n=1 Tax=Deinococcus sp. JMULE3 TaxID=2518341 RepID=UPI001C2DAEF3|nr:helix-turn-helix domain-containing protein [Deinococcus sp. JMULE3]
MSDRPAGAVNDAPLRCAVRERREAAGLSVSALAAQVGLSRQALSRVESGAAVPGTRQALLLARALRCRVEDLFSLGAARLPARVPPGTPPGTRVRLAEVDGAWQALPLSGEAGLRVAADGVLLASGEVEVPLSLDEARRTALVAGCDPALGLLCTSLTGGRAAWVPRASLEALQAAARGEVHAAGLHLGRPERHREVVARELPGARLLRLWQAEQGLIVAPGNPLGVRGPADLPRARLVTRPAGAGGRALLDSWLREAGLDAAGRAARHAAAPVAASPLDAAAAVARGEADVAPGPRSAAGAYGLGLVPLVMEAFDLAVPERHLAHPGVQALIAAARSAAFHADLRSLGGYVPADPAHPLETP